MSLWDSGEQARHVNDLTAAWVRENRADKAQLEDAHAGDFLFYETT